MDIQTLKISKLNPAKYNPRKDLQPGDIAYEKLKKSIIEFSNVEPIVWNKMSGNVIGGHQRLKILKELGHKEVEVSVVNLPDDRERALNVMLNNPNAQGEWDLPKLEELLAGLNVDDFDMELTGFNQVEIKELLAETVPPDPSDKTKENNVIICPKCGHEFGKGE